VRWIEFWKGALPRKSGKERYFALCDGWNEVKRKKERPRPGKRPWYRFAASLVKENLAEGARCLDAGCGDGEFLKILNSFGFEVMGIDGDPEYVNRGRRLNLPVIQANLEEGIPFPEESFDLVVCLEVLEHIVRSEFLVSEIYRVLRKGGMCLVSTPNYGYWQRRVKFLLGKGLDGEGVHTRFFFPATLKELFRDSRFKVKQAASFGPLSGCNFFRRLSGKGDVFWKVPPSLEGFFASTLVYLFGKI